MAKCGTRLAYPLESVADALDKIDEKIPDLIITDLMMPRESGYDLLQKLRRNARTRQVPVIVYSAVSEHGYVSQAMDYGATDYWLKGSVAGPDISQRLRAYLPPSGWSEPSGAHPMNGCGDGWQSPAR
jgi:PleD family two-component response regulator